MDAQGFIPAPRRLLAAAGLALGGTLGLGASAQAATFTVTNLDDSGAGSLRDAIAQANATSAPDTITFASGLTGTIHLASTLVANTYPVAIQGPGASQVTVNGGGSVQDFHVGCLCSTLPTFSISGLTITGGKAVPGTYDRGGGGVENTLGNLNLSDVVITGNTAVAGGTNSTYGGGVDSSGLTPPGGSPYPANLTIDQSTISNNTVVSTGSGFGSGGGVAANIGKLTLTNSTISGNSALPVINQFGGGAYVTKGSAVISGSTFSGNQSASGGGIRFYSSTGPSSIADSTITSNSARYGAGVRFPYDNAGTLTITGSTISGNHGTGVSPTYGGGVDSTAPRHTILQDTIVSGNTAERGPDLYSTGPGAGFDGAFSLIGTVSGASLTETVAGSDVIGADPLLGALANNGGPVETMALPAASPAVDKGAAFGLTADARGVLRPIDFPSIPNSAATGADGSDIGAFELQPATNFTLGKLKLLRKKGKAVQIVNLPLPDAGSVSLSGKGLKTQTQAVHDSGIVKLMVIAKGKVKKALKRRHKAKAKETITYHASGQTPNAVSKKIKLVKR